MKELIFFLRAFPQTISLVRAENHVKKTKLPIQLYSEKKKTKVIILMQLECLFPKSKAGLTLNDLYDTTCMT